MVNGNSQSQLNHPVIETTLLIKWNSIRKWYILNVFFYTIFMGTITSYFVQTGKNDYETDLDILKMVWTILYLCFLTLREITQIVTLRRNYLQSENIIDWIIIISTWIFMLFTLKKHDMAVNALAFAMLFGNYLHFTISY